MHYQQAIEKLARYCAYQERCLQEVNTKLDAMGISHNQAQKIIQELSDEGFIDEKRYALSFVRGKFNQKKWGKIKIYHALRAKGINPSLIELALTHIDDEDYYNTLKELAEQKTAALEGKESDPLKIKHKAYRYLMGKGYESHLITDLLFND
jgi:regulatory protein